MSCESQDPALTKLRQAAEAGTLTVWILHVSIAEMEHCQLANLQNSTKSCLGQRCPRKAFRSNWHSSGEGFFAAHASLPAAYMDSTVYIYIYIHMICDLAGSHRMIDSLVMSDPLSLWTGVGLGT